MANIAYEQKLAEFRAQLERKEKERHTQIARFDKEITALAKIIETLTTLLKQGSGKDPVSASELDDLILDIFKEKPTDRMTRRRILKELLDGGADLSGFSNRMSYVHASLRRLHKKGLLSREWGGIPGSTKKKAIYFLPESEP